MSIRDKHTNIIYYLTAHLIFLAILIYGITSLRDGYEIGFIITSFYLIMPIISFVTGIAMGTKDLRFKWLNSIVLGLIGIAIPFVVFPMSFDIIAIAFSLVPALTGTSIGIIIRNHKLIK